MINCLGTVFHPMYRTINYANKLNLTGIFGMNKENHYAGISISVLSSPDPKVPVDVFDKNLSVFCHRRCRPRKFFTLSSSPLEPLGQSQPDLALSFIR